MGCDIHLFAEKKHNGKWVMVNEVRGKGRQRNYRLFAAIAGVRGEGPAPKGLPIDVSESVNMHADLDGSDGHSHSWMTLREAVSAWNVKRYDDEKDVPDSIPSWGFFELEAEEDEWDDYRVVFWFDN